MGVSTAAGAKLYIGTTASDATTDTYTEIGEVLEIPEFGRVYREITYTPLNNRGEQKFKGSYNDGSINVPLGKDTADAGQALLQVALDLDFDYNFKVLANDDVAPVSFTVTISNASPGVVTKVDHVLTVNTPVVLSTTGALPAGLSIATTYYVKTVLDDDTFTLSATPGGAAIDTSDAGSGTHTCTTVPAGSYQLFKAKVMSYTTKYGDLNSVIGSSVMLSIKSGSLAETARIPLS